MEVLLVSPVKSVVCHPLESSTTIFVLSLINLTTILLLSVFVLQVPIAGNLFSLLSVSLLFIFVRLAGIRIARVVPCPDTGSSHACIRHGDADSHHHPVGHHLSHRKYGRVFCKPLLSHSGTLVRRPGTKTHDRRCTPCLRLARSNRPAGNGHRPDRHHCPQIQEPFRMKAYDTTLPDRKRVQATGTQQFLPRLILLFPCMMMLIIPWAAHPGNRRPAQL